MSQRECPGLNAPRFPVSAGEDVALCPACAVSVSATPRLCRIPADSASSARGVANPAMAAICVKLLPLMFSVICPPRCPSVAAGVVHAHRTACAFKGSVFLSICAGPALFSLSCTVGVDECAKPEQPLPPVRRADARSAQIGCPAGISQLFQVKANSGEPFTSILARNLLSKHRCRAALGDEVVKSGP
jgi:hypothetical protein